MKLNIQKSTPLVNVALTENNGDFYVVGLTHGASVKFAILAGLYQLATFRDNNILWAEKDNTENDLNVTTLEEAGKLVALVTKNVEKPVIVSFPLYNKALQLIS